MKPIVLPELKCQRCGKTWNPRSINSPKNCPHCKSPYWDKPRKVQTPE
jgi:predicted Zn-ribbon and HTH transcriptional regulator